MELDSLWPCIFCSHLHQDEAYWWSKEPLLWCSSILLTRNSHLHCCRCLKMVQASFVLEETVQSICWTMHRHTYKQTDKTLTLKICLYIKIRIGRGQLERTEAVFINKVLWSSQIFLTQEPYIVRSCMSKACILKLWRDVRITVASAELIQLSSILWNTNYKCSYRFFFTGSFPQSVHRNYSFYSY